MEKSSYRFAGCPTDLPARVIQAFEKTEIPPVLDGTIMLKILLAEDNTLNQQLSVKILEKYNHTVSVVGNGLEAVDLVKTRKSDVINAHGHSDARLGSNSPLSTSNAEITNTGSGKV